VQPTALAAWSDRLAELFQAVGQYEKRAAERFEEILARLALQHHDLLTTLQTHVTAEHEQTRQTVRDVGDRVVEDINQLLTRQGARTDAADAAQRLAAAQQRLAEMPLDVPPPPAPALPPGSRMPLQANPLFVGRVQDLQTLAATLMRGQTAAIATGLGGIGKTQLAVEFVHRYGPYFAGGVFWLSFATPC
jgi:hypothetical protein